MTNDLFIQTTQQHNPNKQISNLNKIEKFIESLEKNKAAPENIAEILADALYATDRVAEPDYSSRIKAAEILLKVFKIVVPEGSISNIDARSINITMSEKSIDRLNKMITHFQKFKEVPKFIEDDSSAAAKRHDTE